MRLERVMALLALVSPAFAQYGGPALLTRGEAPSAMSAPEIHFQPFVDVSGVWDSGLAAVRVTDTGQLADESSFGMSVAWGVSGSHSWRHTRLGLSYIGSVDHYFRQTAFDSLNQSLLLGIVHQLNRRMTLSLSASAGMFSRDPGLIGLQQTVPFDPTTTYIPRTDFFDNRTIYVTTMAGLTIQKSARLSFGLNGSGFLARRRSTALYGTVGAGAGGDVQYRVSRYSTIGAEYTYGHYDYLRLLADTDVHGVALSYARQFTAHVEFSAFGGAMRAESRFLESVPLDPAVAQLLGISSTSLVGHQIYWGPNFGARLSRAFRTGVAYVNAGRSITPGNGLFLTSTATMVTAGYGYTGIRRWTFGASVSYSDAKAIGYIQGRYNSLSGSVSCSRRLMRWVHFTASYAASEYGSPDYSKYNRVVHSVRVGLGFAPGDVPLRIW